MTKILFTTLLTFFFTFGFAQNIPTLGFIGIPAKFASVENYKRMKDAGFSISLSTFDNLEDALKSLSYAEKAGIKLILFFPQIHTDSKNTIPSIKKSKALLGYFIGDEPTPKDFPNFVTYADIIKEYDKEHLFYVNLHPIYVPQQYLQGLSYKEYISKAVSKLPATYISFDHYPLVKNVIRNNFYENLEIIKTESQRVNKPFWGFACSTIHFDYLEPTIAGIKLQNFANLLYGAQGIQYFTYWTMTSDPNWKKDNYSYAIVNEKGEPTPTYNIVKTVNQQIQRLAWVFSGAKTDSVYHIGNQIPAGTTKMMTAPKGFKYFSTNGKNAMVSKMTNGNAVYTIIQNKSLTENLTVEYQLLKPMRIINNITGQKEIIGTAKKNKSVILPGDILIFIN